MISIRTLTAAACIAGSLAVPALAQDGAMSPAAKEQLSLSDKLIALGRERKDAFLILAGAHLRINLTNDPIGEPGDLSDKDALLEEAKTYAAGRQDLVGIADDIKAANARGCYNWNGGTGSFSCPPGSQFAK